MKPMLKLFPIVESTYGINRYVIKATQYVFFHESKDGCSFTHQKEIIFGLIINKKYPKQYICLN